MSDAPLGNIPELRRWKSFPERALAEEKFYRSVLAARNRLNSPTSYSY
jgi:hypothetical protein